MSISHTNRRLPQCFGFVLLLIVTLSIELPYLEAQTSFPISLANGAVGENPNYFYDRETAFMIAYAVDYDEGGVYMAVRPDGSLITDLGSELVTNGFWGVPISVFGDNTVEGTEKSLFGLGTCIRYFIQEYQRTEALRINYQGGVDEINAQLVAMGRADLRLTYPSDLLTYAQSCADFIARHMIIDRVDDGVDEDPFNANALDDPWTNGGPDIGDVIQPNRVYYWTSVSRDGTDRFVDDTLPDIARSAGAPRAEGIIPWSMAELALIMHEANPASNWVAYRDMAQAWWNWRQTTADELPDYDDTTPPDSNDLLNWQNCSDRSLPNRCLAGGARDTFYPALSYLLNILAGEQNPSGAPYEEGYTFGHDNTLSAPWPPTDPLQDGTYVAGYARGIVYANIEQRGATPSPARNALWGDFGSYAVGHPDGRNLGALANPFVHFDGRERLAGTLRATWFYHTFQTGTGISPTRADSENLIEDILNLWERGIADMWDFTPNQEAWYRIDQYDV